MVSIPLNFAIPVLLAYLGYAWHSAKTMRGAYGIIEGRKRNWTPTSASYKFDQPCPADTTTQTVFFGGTSMLGRYIIDTWREDASVCVINFGRSKCPRCHVNVKGDLRDSDHVGRMFDHYDIETVVTAVKPPLLDIEYQAYLELNFYSIVELTKLAKSSGAKNLIMVSSIAASSHYVKHHMSTEEFPQPRLTEYEAPYDVSKRLGEEFVLGQHSTGSFNTVSIRTSGIIGGDGDPYDYMRMFPFLPSFNTPAVVDSNYAGNIAEALKVVDATLKSNPAVGGQFYYYTGEHLSEAQQVGIISEVNGKPVLLIPYSLLEIAVDWWIWLRWDWSVYTTLDLLRMAIVEQTFDQTKFHAAFPDFTPSMTMKQALTKLYSPK